MNENALQDALDQIDDLEEELRHAYAEARQFRLERDQLRIDYRMAAKERLSAQDALELRLRRAGVWPKNGDQSMPEAPDDSVKIFTESGEEMHPAVLEVLQYFTWDHLPPHLQPTSKAVGELAFKMARTLPQCPALTRGLVGLLRAKDDLVRAVLRTDDVGRNEKIAAAILEIAHAEDGVAGLGGADRVTRYADTPAGQALAQQDLEAGR